MDYYTRLGVGAKASQDEIKRAYRKLASKHHPDRGGDEAQFKLVQEAYETLSDPNRRQQYDNPQPQGFSFEDMFRQAGPFGQKRPSRSHDTVVNLEIPMEQMIHGGEVLIDVGYMQEVLKLDAGVPDGYRVRMPGRGQQAGPNIPPGDLIVRIHVKYPNNIARQGNDIYQRVSVNCLYALVGGETQFKSYDGRTLKIKIPKGTQTGDKLRLGGMGIKNVRHNAVGNLFLIIELFTPKIENLEHLNMLNIIINDKEEK